MAPAHWRQTLAEEGREPRLARLVSPLVARGRALDADCSQADLARKELGLLAGVLAG